MAHNDIPLTALEDSRDGPSTSSLSCTRGLIGSQEQQGPCSSLSFANRALRNQPDDLLCRPPAGLVARATVPVGVHDLLTVYDV